jgi:hypothetical protein
MNRGIASLTIYLGLFHSPTALPPVEISPCTLYIRAHPDKKANLYSLGGKKEHSLPCTESNTDSSTVHTSSSYALSARIDLHTDNSGMVAKNTNS